MKKEEKKNVKARKKIKVNPKRLVISIGILLLLVVAIYMLFAYLKASPYLKYKKQIEEYGFDVVYNNKKANTLDKVSKSELVKMLTAVTSNKKTTDEFMIDMYHTETYPNAPWMEYARVYGVNTSINTSNEADEATLIDLVVIGVQAIESFTGVNIGYQKATFKNIYDYSEQEQSYISKAIAAGLIENSDKNFKEDSVIHKGILNKAMCNIIEKYATIYYKTLFDQYEDGETKATIVTDETLLPSNYTKYPYIISTITKEEYEMPENVQYDEGYMAPKEAFEYRGKGYIQTEKNIEKYLNLLLNVDYNTINESLFISQIEPLMVYEMTQKVSNEKTYETLVKEYISYVKENEIKLEGKAQALLPILYKDGITYRVRVKVDFKILSSNTKQNLLLGDKNITYNGNTFSVYVELPVGIIYDELPLYIYNQTSIMSSLTKANESIEVGHE